MSDTDNKTNLTIRELRDRWKLSQRTAERLIADGTVPSFKVGGLRRIPIKAVEDIESGKTK